MTELQQSGQGDGSGSPSWEMLQQVNAKSHGLERHQPWRELRNRSELEKQVDTYSKKFANQPIQRPAYWGGYKIVPDYFEFWQGRPSRLHDRIAYSLQNKEWKVSRLNP